MSLRIGTSGWSYPTGQGTWNGLFYPASRSKRAGTAGFDELRFYAEHFDTVEVNSTFYGQPRAEVTRGWVDRTPAGFEFSVKLYQKFTHPKMFRAAALTTAPGSDGPLLDVLAQVTRSDIDDFRTGIEPLAASAYSSVETGANCGDRPALMTASIHETIDSPLAKNARSSSIVRCAVRNLGAVRIAKYGSRAAYASHCGSGPSPPGRVTATLGPDQE